MLNQYNELTQWKGCSVVTLEEFFKIRYRYLKTGTKFKLHQQPCKYRVVKCHLDKYLLKSVHYVWILVVECLKKVPSNLLPVDFVLSYARRGELLDYIHKLSSFDEPCTKWYTAEIVAALEYLHSKGIIHRLVQMSHHSKPLFLYKCLML